LNSNFILTVNSEFDVLISVCVLPNVRIDCISDLYGEDGVLMSIG